MISYCIERNNFIDLRWEQDFDCSMFMNATKFSAGVADFKDVKTRTDLLKDNEYKTERIEVTFYGAMLKRLLQSSDANFVKQGKIEAVQIEWYGRNGQLKFNVYGIDAVGKQTGGDSTIEPDQLHETLKNTDMKVDPTTFESAFLLGLLGFKEDALPKCNVARITLLPAICKVLNEGTIKSKFTMAIASVPVLEDCDPDNKAAYGPPCPPFCYPK